MSYIRSRHTSRPGAVGAWSPLNPIQKIAEDARKRASAAAAAAPKKWSPSLKPPMQVITDSVRARMAGTVVAQPTKPSSGYGKPMTMPTVSARPGASSTTTSSGGAVSVPSSGGGGSAPIYPGGGGGGGGGGGAPITTPEDAQLDELMAPEESGAEPGAEAKSEGLSTTAKVAIGVGLALIVGPMIFKKGSAP